jgi:hypothetical protein
VQIRRRRAVDREDNQVRTCWVVCSMTSRHKSALCTQTNEMTLSGNEASPTGSDKASSRSEQASACCNYLALAAAHFG